ncbi:putative signal transducing protein [Aureibacter tunicatorum]|uniref:DUF2007 domain-containing protein n=1 Tax=Aureibacter tunicatorum TaxID=866807 RepID=A0AAE4BQT7_9BACT|nr:DUF2007 domain-containing protein [Aureibacter tunicatorum]MDR6237253.1 hypothetical protein [Aureibacter tunicatorum]BDD06245.1 hypothetical protein AUTU_37280 [Aureibacter tunicatorum]
MKEWVVAYNTQDQIRAEMVKDLLLQKGIAAVVVNKMSSPYQMFGEYEVKVNVDQILKAKGYIEHVDFE